LAGFFCALTLRLFALLQIAGRGVRDVTGGMVSHGQKSIRANFQSKTTAQTGIAPNSERAAAAFGELSTIGSLP